MRTISTMAGIATTLAAQCAAEARAVVDPAMIAVPALDGAITAADRADFDKYFYFHRDGTDFPTALADIRYCDGLASGLTPGTGNPVLGGLALAGVSGAIASGNRRALRRVNLRRCMFFKGYQRFGVPKAVWAQFNFEEGSKPLAESERTPFLLQQAKIASGSHPAGKALGE
jgi:hypothetical protein